MKKGTFMRYFIAGPVPMFHRELCEAIPKSRGLHRSLDNSQKTALPILYLLCFALTLSLFSCHQPKPKLPAAPTSNGVYISNEGDFNSGQGEISYYNPVTDTISNGLFYAINNYKLGDVVQSMYIKDSTGFIVVNNSAKVEVVKIPSLKHILTISIPNSSPRYFLPVNDSVGYVTDIYKSEVHVINYLTGALITNITGLSEWTEHIIMVNGIVVVEERNLLSSPASTGSLVTLNPANNTFIQRFSFTGSNVDGLVNDNQNHIWFGMDADSIHSIPAAIFCLNSDLSLNKKIVMPTGHTASNLKINGTGDKVYYLDNNGVNVISITDTAAPSAPLIPINSRNLYGLGIDPKYGDVYVSDGLDYVQRSKIYRYDASGNLKDSFLAGVISGNFVFSYE
jgi:hypothetical protein